MTRSRIKQHGIHYTPPELARFLARVTIAAFNVPPRGPIRVLDPACGDGELLAAIHAAVPAALQKRLLFFGFETDDHALAVARERLGRLGVPATLESSDFLQDLGLGLAGAPSLFDTKREASAPIDASPDERKALQRAGYVFGGVQ